MEVWINGQKVGGDVSHQPDQGQQGRRRRRQGDHRRRHRQAGPARRQGPLHRRRRTGPSPIADVSDYLVDGENKIVIDYNSALANVQLDRGVVPQTPRIELAGWWGNDQVYLSFGPKQAKLVPFVESAYPSDAFDGIRWHIDQAEDAGTLTGNALKQVRKHVDQAEKLTGTPAGDTQLDNAIRKSAGSPALIQALEAVAAS